MKFMVNGHNAITIVIVSFIISAILVPIVRKLAFHVGAVDEPNERRINKVPMPSLGGIAIFISFLFGYMLFADKSNEMLAILIGSFLLLITGMLDDIKPIKARYKLIVQIIVGAIITYYGNITLSHIDAFGISFDFGFLSNIITILFIVGITNSINLIDGMDGLAAGVSSIYYLTVAIIAFIVGQVNGLDTVLTLIMLGATLGFLAYNFPPALLYMGDSGSLLLGYTISLIALLGFKNITLTSLIIPLVILAIPIFDTALAIFRRLIKHKNIAEPDKEHLHHQLLKMKFSQKKSVLIIYMINMVFSAVSIFYVLGNKTISMILYLIIMIVLLLIVLKTNILFEHKNNNLRIKKRKIK